MVARLAALSFLVLISCNRSEQTPSEQAAAPVTTVGVSAADTSNATTVSLADAHIDSLYLRYQPGDVFRYRVTQLSQTGSDSMTAITKTTHVYTKKVTSIRGDGSYALSMKFDSIRVTSTVKNKITGATLEEQSYSSADTAMRKDPKYTSFNALIGEEISIIIDNHGLIQEISGVSSVVNRIIAANPSIPKEAAAQITKQVEVSVYAAFVEVEYLRFPTSRIDTSGAWSTSTTAPLMNLFTATNTVNYRITSVKKVANRTLADVEGSMNGTITVNKLPADAPVKVKLSTAVIRGTGRAVVDVAKGFTVLKQNTVSTIVEGNVRNVATGLTSPLSQQTSLSYSVELLR